MKGCPWFDVRRMLRTATLLLLSLAGTMALAQDYPTKPIRLVVPFPPGGPTDIVARPLAQFLSEALKQQVIVDNRGGAGGGIGAELVAKAVPDGYTLLMATVGTHAINATLYKSLGYDPIKDFTPIARIGYFYRHESCGQCTPCREGAGWTWRVLERMARGESETAEIDMLLDVVSQIEGHTICEFGSAVAWPVQGLIRHFRQEIEDRITNYRQGRPHVQGATLAAE